MGPSPIEPPTAPADTDDVPAYNEKEAQIIERIKRGELRFDPDLLWLVLHFLNNRLDKISLPLQYLKLHQREIPESLQPRLESIRNALSEINSFLTELRELSESSS